MTFNEIRTLYKGGVYNPVRVKLPSSVSVDTIFDENQTVRWNREKAEAINNKRKEAMAKNRAAENEVSRCFKNDIISALQDEYRFSSSQAALIYQRAYESGHSAGYGEVLQDAEDLADFIKEFESK